jgi:hypothetical protein
MGKLISMADNRRFLPVGSITLVYLCSAALLLSSCGEEGIRTDNQPTTTPGQNEPVVTMGLSLSEMTPGTANNIRIYRVNGESGTDQGRFSRKLLQVERDDEMLVAKSVPTGTWDFALVTTLDGVGMTGISDPVAGQKREDDVMLRLTPSGTELPQAPELIMGNVDGQPILPNQTNTVPGTTELARNVAKLEITLKKPKGYSTEAGVHTLTLGNIPTTLNWKGELEPSKTAPAVATGAVMSGRFEIRDKGDGTLLCDTLTFLVPAHRGSDFMEEFPADTTTCKLTVSVKLKLNTPSGTEYYEKGPVEIPVTPKANRRLRVFLIPSEARLEVESAVVDWDYKQNEIIFE